MVWDAPGWPVHGDEWLFPPKLSFQTQVESSENATLNQGWDSLSKVFRWRVRSIRGLRVTAGATAFNDGPWNQHWRSEAEIKIPGNNVAALSQGRERGNEFKTV